MVTHLPNSRSSSSLGFDGQSNQQAGQGANHSHRDMPHQNVCGPKIGAVNFQQCGTRETGEESRYSSGQARGKHRAAT